MDQAKMKRLSDLAQHQVETANRYANARKLSGRAERDLKIIIASEITKLRTIKKNIGIEFATLLIVGQDETARILYAEWTEQEAVYKGLEKVLEAQASQLMWEMSLNKFQKEGERYG